MTPLLPWKISPNKDITEPSRVGEARGRKEAVEEGMFEPAMVANMEPDVIIVQEILTDVAGPSAPPPQNLVDIVRPLAPPPENVS